MKSLASALFIATTIIAAPANAEDYDASAAFGVARVVALSDRCGYKIDDDAMAAYLKDHGLSGPEATGFIVLKVSLDQPDAKSASDAECSVVKSTAKLIGIVNP